MSNTKLCELFAYENIINDKTNKARVLVWNNRTMLIAEENSELFCDKQMTFDELFQGAVSGDRNAVNVFLYSAMFNSNDNFSIDEFIDYFDWSEYDGYAMAVLDGLSHYLPDKKIKTELEELIEADSSDDENADQWASLYFFSKKYLLMSDEEFLNSTWRKISILQREFKKTLPSSQRFEITPADKVDFI